MVVMGLNKAFKHSSVRLEGDEDRMTDKLIICRCEEVDLEAIQDTITKYDCSAREVKLRTRAGMGYCGGRTCRPALDAVIKNLSGERQPNEIPLKVQPPVRPVSLGKIGGE